MIAGSGRLANERILQHSWHNSRLLCYSSEQHPHGQTVTVFFRFHKNTFFFSKEWQFCSSNGTTWRDVYIRMSLRNLILYDPVCCDSENGKLINLLQFVYIISWIFLLGGRKIKFTLCSLNIEIGHGLLFL